MTTTPVLPYPAAAAARPSRAGLLAVEIVSALALVGTCLALCVNWFWVYFQLFSMPPDINPVTLGIHRSLLLAGVLAVAGMGVAAWVARRGWRWTAVAAGMFLTVAAFAYVEGTLPWR